MNRLKKILFTFTCLLMIFLFSCGIKEISISGNKEVTVGETLQLTVNFDPSDKSDTINWSSSDESLATVKDGLVTTLKDGTVKIKAEVASDASISDEVSVVILPKKVMVNEITVTGKQEMIENETQDLTINVLPAEATNKEYTLKVSDESILKLEGLSVKALKAGTSKVIATSKDGSEIKGELEITVKKALELVSLKGNGYLFINESSKLVAELSKDTEVQLVWKSNNEEIATVENGNVFGKKEGEVKISCYLPDDLENGKEITINVIDASKVELTLSPKEPYSLVIGNELTLEYNCNNSLLNDFVWQTSDESICKVENGLVTLLAEGDATITLSLKDYPQIKAEYKLTVLPKVPTNLELEVLLKDLLSKYLNATQASLNITLINGTNTFNQVYGFELNESNELVKLINYSKNTIESFIMIKDNVCYMNVNGTKGKYEIAAEEVSEILSSSNIDSVLSPLVKFFNDDAFFAALSFDKKDGDKVVYTLNIQEYKGSVIQTVNADKIELTVSFDQTGDKGISCVEYTVYSEDLIKKEIIEFSGLSFLLDYPDDLDTYPEA